MSQFFDKQGIRESAKTGKPYEAFGLLIYPLTVKQYDTFVSCESALTMRMSALPVIYAAKTYAQALFGMYLDEKLQDSPVRGSWAKFLWLLCESLHINNENLSQQVRHVVDKKDQTNLTALIITQYTSEAENVVRLGASQIGQIREIIAELNGRHLPDESENLELIQADEDIRLLNGTVNLDVDTDDLIASVASYQHRRFYEIEEWTIWEFEKIRDAMERERRFTVSNIGEMSGMVKWERGNPYPSLFFNKQRENLGVVSAEAFQRRVSGAVQTVDALPNLPSTLN